MILLFSIHIRTPNETNGKFSLESKNPPIEGPAGRALTGADAAAGTSSGRTFSGKEILAFR